MSSIAPIPPHSSVPLQPKRLDLSRAWFWLGMLAIFLLSLVLRFWGLSRFNTLVFDEVYYARFASHFLKGELIFTGHPPLSTYIVAIGIWIGQHLPGGNDDIKNGLSGLLLSPFAYRWLNALVGSLIPLVVAAIAYQLSHRRSFALITGLLIAADGLYLVESRYALNNVYLVIFGLLGHLFFLIALKAGTWQRWLWVSLAGIGFGSAASIKWNGMGFLLGAYLVWITGWIVHGVSFIQHRRNSKLSPPPKLSKLTGIQSFPLHNLVSLHLGHVLIGLALIPALTYYVSWIPYMQLDPGSNFWDLNLQTLDYHKQVGGLDAHPYCSLWYTWPLMLRPIAYFYQTTHGGQEPVPVIGPPTPGNAGTVIYDVHAMGNPFLWWFSTAAIVLLVILLGQWIWQGVLSWGRGLASGNMTSSYTADPTEHTASSHPYHWITLYLVINWSANLLPWIKVTRCIFIYHYMGSLIFAVLALALILDRWLYSPSRQRQAIGITVITAILLAFAFWMPLYLGLPLSPAALEIRRWLPSWI